MIFQTIFIWSKMIHSLKYLRFPTFKRKDIGIRKSEFVTKTQFLFEIIPFILDLFTMFAQSVIKHFSTFITSLVVYSMRCFSFSLGGLQTKFSFKLKINFRCKTIFLGFWFNFDKIAIACQSKVVNKLRERLQLHFLNKSKDFIPRGFSYLKITVRD